MPPSPLYWYVAAWEIWGNPITVICEWPYVSSNENGDSKTESVTKLFCMPRAIRLAENEYNLIYQIIINSWYKVTHMWLVMGLSRIYRIVGSSPDQVKPKAIKLVCVASLLSTQHWGERAETDWHGIMIINVSEWSDMSISAADCSFSKIPL